MDPHILLYVRVILKRIRDWALYIILGIGVISFAIMGFGVTVEPKYATSITIFADNKNVIKPLLEGQASVTMPKTERIRIVQETLFAPRLLDEILPIAYPDFNASDTRAAEKLKAELRSDIDVSAPASNYVQISYAHASPRASYQLVNTLTNLFIEESANNKRTESKSAFNFIDEQVASYKQQLVEAENKLKAFEAANIDGVESQVNAAIAQLQTGIEEIAISIQTEEVKIEALREQLENEGRFAANDYNARVYRDRLAQLEAQLSTMLLSLRDQHPDVVELKLQIQELKQVIAEVEDKQASGLQQTDMTSGQRINPIYEELSNQLATARVNVQTLRHRLEANERRLQEQYERRVRVASNQAELSELTRDYSVTRQIYEDLLSRKEKARISMTLDMTGQGVSYKILEPAAFPVLPSGIRFRHFVMAGPFAGLFIALGLVVVIVVLDNRILFAEQLNDRFPGIVMAVLPENPIGGQWKTAVISVAGLSITYSLTAVGIAFYL